MLSKQQIKQLDELATALEKLPPDRQAAAFELLNSEPEGNLQMGKKPIKAKNLKDLPPDLEKAIRAAGVRSPRRLTKETIRQAAIKCLAVIADHPQKHREVILRHAIEVNKV